MYKTLAPHAIGVKPNDLQSAIAAAKLNGFAGLEFNGPEIADLIDSLGSDAVREKFADAKIIPAGWGLPVEWRKTDEVFNRDMALLPRAAKAARALGATRCFTWVMPCSNERALEANWQFHIERFTPIAQTLAEFGQHLGLEFIGPKTLRDSQKYPFIWTLKEMLRLGRQIGPNVGLLLDAWHWYTSHGSLGDITSLKPDQVVYVHVNDAPAGIEIDKQIDNVRALPGETGVIDMAGFLNALEQIGYDGPVTPEPFKKELRDLPDDATRLKTVGAAMDKIWGQAAL